MSDNVLPYGRQWVDDEDIQAVVDVLRSDFLTTGPMVAAFERGLCEASQATEAIAVNSGTAALHVAYFAAGLEAGDEIITSPMTFAATGNAALYLGAGVKFVDVEPDTGNIDARLLESALTDRTKLVVPIDFAGHPAEYDAVNAFAQDHNLTVVADAAHSLGATYRGRPVGTLAAASEVSSHPVKPITTGEGGAVLTSDPIIAERARAFRTHGIHRDQPEMGGWYYEMRELGFNYRLTDIQCALGLSQLRRLEGFIARRREIAARYMQALSSVSGLELPGVRSHVEPGWHLYVVRVPEAKYRRPFFDRLRELGIYAQVHYIPVYWHPYYQELGFKKGLCPVAEDFYERAVSIPMYPAMTDEQLESSIERISRAATEVWG
jgi:perosamine synthetase